MIMDDVDILRAACCVAGLDAAIGRREHRLLLRLAERAGVGAASLSVMMEQARTDPDFYQKQLRYISSNSQRAVQALKSVLAMAAADGQVSADERIILHYFADKLGVPEATFAKLLAAAEKLAARAGAADPEG